MSDLDKLRETLTSWPAIIIGFCFGGWPGFLLLLWKILHEASGKSSGTMSDSVKRSFFGSESTTKDVYWDRSTQRWVHIGETSAANPETPELRYDDPAATYRYSYRKEETPTSSRSTVTKTAADTSRTKKSPTSGAGAASPFPKIKDGKVLMVAGAVLTAFFGLITVYGVVDMLSYAEPLWIVEDNLFPFMCTGISAGMYLWGRFKNKQAKTFRKLLTIIGDAKRVSVRTLSEASGVAYHKVCDLLQTMIDAGYLGYRSYLNMATGELVLDGSAVTVPQPEEKQEAPAAPQPELTQEEDIGLLAQIRKVNDAIPDAEMTRKISRIEEITSHILDYQDKHPDKAADLRKFLSYYLPTTLKILNTYAELDRQRVSGENVTATKQRIEGMMDKVVEGFELQLDKLYENEMLDISSDISVMETMLSQDGLSNDESRTMRVPKAPDPAIAAREAAAKEAIRQNDLRRAATAANANYTTPNGIHLTLDPQNDEAASSTAATAE
jgi:hypothetical protein